MVRTPQLARLLALLLLLAVAGTACSATPSWIPVESAATTSDAPAELAFVEDNERAAARLADDARVEPTDSVEVEQPEPTPTPVPGPSPAFCEASANIWIHSAALNQLGADANPEMHRVALANVAEWLERSTLDSDEDIAPRLAMFAAFVELEATVARDFNFDWGAFTASSDYAKSSDALTYEAERDALVSFLNNECDGLRMSQLADQAEARATELLDQFRAEPSSVVESDSLPGHSIFTHSSGRLIASFPTAWSYDEGRSDAIVDLLASPDVDRFLAGEALDGVRLQLRPATDIDEFRLRIDETDIASTCERTKDVTDAGRTRLNITQTFVCADHGASIIGQYREDRGLGLIIEARFDRVDPSQADVLRLASIANSALWS